MVHAYKNLTQEKSALEASVNALSAAGSRSQSAATTPDGSSDAGEDRKEGFEDPLGAKDQVNEQPDAVNPVMLGTNSLSDM